MGVTVQRLEATRNIPPGFKFHWRRLEQCWAHLEPRAEVVAHTSLTQTNTQHKVNIAAIVFYILCSAILDLLIFGLYSECVQCSAMSTMTQ